MSNGSSARKVVPLEISKAEISPQTHPEVGEKFMAAIVESSDDAILGITPEGNIASWNQGAEKMFGYTHQEAVGKNLSIIYPKHNLGEIKEILGRITRGERIDHFETQRQNKNKAILDVSLSISPVKDSKGKIIGISKIIRDISGQKRATGYARSLIEASLDPLVTISTEGKITDVNEATIQVTGSAREELIGSDFSNYFTESEKARQGYQEVFSKGKVTDYALTIRRKDGKLTDVLYNAAVYKDTRGNVLGIFAAARDVTEQKQAAQYARSLIESSLDPLVTISAEGKITDVNEATIQVTGCTKEELIGSDFSNYFAEPEKARQGYQEVFSKGKVTDYALTIRRKDGKLTGVLYNAAVYKDTRGNVLGVFAAARDVTEQKQAAQYARSLIESSLDPLVTISPEGKITDVNEATIQVTGCAKEELIGSDFSNYFTEPEEAREGYQQVFKEGFVRDYPLAIRHKSGKITYVLYNATVYRNPEGKVIGVFAAARDVTERKKAEDQLHSTSAYARSLIESSLDPLLTISPEGKITDVNHSTEEITGVMREWLIGTDFSNYFTEPRLARAGYRQVFKEGKVIDYPLIIRKANGQMVDVLYNASVYRDAQGKVQGVFAAARDVSKQKQAAQYARSLIEASLDPLVTISAEGKITDVNEATIQVTGRKREELIGSDFSNYFTEPEKARQGYQEVFSKGKVTDYALTLRHKSGQTLEVLYNASVYRDAQDNVLGVFAAARDNSRAKKAQEQFQETNKELESFSYSVSHDLRAPLRQIDGFTKILEEDHSKNMNEEGKRTISVIRESAKKMGQLVDSLLEFSRLGKKAVRPQYIDMGTMVRNISQELKTNESPSRTIEFKIGEFTDQSVDQKLIEQVWVNLISNSLKFTKNKEKAVIEVGCTQEENENIYFVKDNGVGFDPHFKENLFQVFSRLHSEEEFKGSGIGLAMCKKIIEQHSGKMWAEGALNQGATFYFSLPKR